MHRWGDDWPHWDQLYESEKNIKDEFEKRTGLVLSLKEKYGSIRYEHVMDPSANYSFADTIENWMILKEIVFAEVEKHPEIEDELLIDLATNEEIVGTAIHDRYWQRLL